MGWRRELHGFREKLHIPRAASYLAFPRDSCSAAIAIEAVPCGEQDGDGSSGVARRDGLSRVVPVVDGEAQSGEHEENAEDSGDENAEDSGDRSVVSP